MRPDLTTFLALPATVVAVELFLVAGLGRVLDGWRKAAGAPLALMRNAALSDAEKQDRMARASLAMLSSSLRLAAIIALVLAGFGAATAAGLVVLDPAAGLADTLMRADFAIASVLAAVAWLWVRNRVFG